MANKLKPQDIYELLDGYNSELDTLDDSDDEQVPNELHQMNEEGKFPNEVLETLLAEFDTTETFFENETNDEPNAEVDLNLNYTHQVLNYFDKILRMDVTAKNEIKWVSQPFVPPKLSIDDIMQDLPIYIDIPSPLHYFNRYFSDSDFENMALYTNMYAHQNTSSWKKNTDKYEIRTFIALHILTGCLRFARISMYWDTFIGINVFINNMSRNRFYSLRSNFHVIDNMKIPTNNKDRFVKVRPMFDCVLKRCRELVKERNLSIDEQIVPFTGHLNVKQYCKGKPNPWGIKIFMLCGASGVIYDFIIYQGSETEFCPQFKNKFGLGASVVLQLTEHVEENKHFLFFDNYFASYNLFEILLQRKIFAASTIRVDRFSKPPFMNDKVLASIGKGATHEIRNDKNTIALLKWYDNKSVHMASNFIASGNVDHVERWDKKIKEYDTVERPEVIQLYNKSMGGVDKIDQLIAYYRIFLKSKKWTLRMVFHSIDMAICNSWLEYLQDCNLLGIEKKKQMDLLHFKMRLADNLINLGRCDNIKRPRGRPTSASTPSPSPPFKKKKRQKNQSRIKKPVTII
ncbi:piggyBac transposable element-derived protein 3-like [Metopolophium dirhodum]|uniref:piggyBac transposable element-derived protein 3-like n=1 Tax=Metopolophium dirhodum TaxID=44670 RepID=UPI00298FD141|nr:piggyBac transposable element-derived protein 3-like [Metopolophium dirhodum]